MEHLLERKVEECENSLFFLRKMEKIEKQMETFEKQMDTFEKQMELFENQMEPFETKIETFEKKMETFEKKMETFEKIPAKSWGQTTILDCLSKNPTDLIPLSARLRK